MQWLLAHGYCIISSGSADKTYCDVEIHRRKPILRAQDSNRSTSLLVHPCRAPTIYTRTLCSSSLLYPHQRWRRDRHRPPASAKVERHRPSRPNHSASQHPDGHLVLQTRAHKPTHSARLSPRRSTSSSEAIRSARPATDAADSSSSVSSISLLVRVVRKNMQNVAGRLLQMRRLQN